MSNEGAAAVPLPDTPAGRHLEWVLSALVDLPTEEVLAAHFNGEFLAQVPLDQMRAVFEQLKADGPHAVTSIESSQENALVVNLDGREARFRIDIAVEPDAPHLISELFFAPAER